MRPDRPVRVLLADLLHELGDLFVVFGVLGELGVELSAFKAWYWILTRS